MYSLYLIVALVLLILPLRAARPFQAISSNALALCHLYPVVLDHYSQLPKSWRNPKNLEISLGEGFCGSRGDAAFSLCLG